LKESLNEISKGVAWGWQSKSFEEKKIQTKGEKNLTIFVVVLVDETATTTKTNCTRDLFLKLKIKRWKNIKN